MPEPRTAPYLTHRGPRWYGAALAELPAIRKVELQS